MVERVIAVDYDKCTGCRICESICAMAKAGECNPEKARIRIVKIEEYGNTISIPVVCMNCLTPACKVVCPTKAVHKNQVTGVMVVDNEKCIGCSACVYACPFGAITVDRLRGSSFKCDQCEGDPTCVKVCPSNAIEYVKDEEISIRLRRSAVDKLKSVLITKRE
jgi:carbon-monoxide dehydrogenase iron sulfur subunit